MVDAPNWRGGRRRYHSVALAARPSARGAGPVLSSSSSLRGCSSLSLSLLPLLVSRSAELAGSFSAVRGAGPTVASLGPLGLVFAPRVWFFSRSAELAGSFSAVRGAGPTVAPLALPTPLGPQWRGLGDPEPLPARTLTLAWRTDVGFDFSGRASWVCQLRLSRSAASRGLLPLRTLSGIETWASPCVEGGVGWATQNPYLLVRVPGPYALRSWVNNVGGVSWVVPAAVVLLSRFAGSAPEADDLGDRGMRVAVRRRRPSSC